MDQKTAFVIMPIRSSGSEEHRHFRTLYEQFLKPTLEQRGFEVTRADEVQKAGAITRDVIMRLAQASLVVADLTTWNPNVFYELGLRHCFRRSGTLMIVDEERTESIPFDLQAYRVIKFRGNLEGIGQLSMQIRAYVDSLEADDLTTSGDNPVHDWLPHLPPNVLSAVGDNGQEARLAKLAELVGVYQRRYGPIDVSQSMDGSESPMSVVQAAILEAEEGNLPRDVLGAAKTAVGNEDYKGFLVTARRLLEMRQFTPTGDQFIEMAHLAQIIGLWTIQVAILKHAMELSPNEKVEQAYIASLAHSREPKERAEARERISKKLNVSYEDGHLIVPESWMAIDIKLCAIMLDAYHADGLHHEAEELARRVAEVYPTSDVALRNYARSLEKAGRADDALQAYRAAVMVNDGSDESASWFGNELHNRERHVDAIEAYALACMRDPRDANLFANLAWEIGLAMDPAKHPRSGRGLPAQIGRAEGSKAILATFSGEGMSVVGRSYVERAIDSMELDKNQLVADLEHEGRMLVADRHEFARKIYSHVRSDLTNREAVFTVPGLEHIDFFGGGELPRAVVTSAGHRSADHARPGAAREDLTPDQPGAAENRADPRTAN